MLTIIGFILGIVWLIFLCVVAILSIIKVINKVKHKTESIRLQRIFTFLLKSIIPFFLVLFFVGGCSTMFADPKFYYCVVYQGINGSKKNYNKKLYDEFVQNRYDFLSKNKKLSNGYFVDYFKNSFNFFNIELSEAFVYYEDSSNAEHLIYSYNTCDYTEYGLWLGGDEGGGFYLRFKRQ